MEGVAINIDAVRERVVRLSTERVRTRKKGQIALTERQMRIVEYINKHGKMNSGDVAAMFKTSRQAALKEIGKLVDLEIVKREGQADSKTHRIDCREVQAGRDPLPRSLKVG